MTDIQRYVPAADGGGAEMEKDDYGAWVSLDDHQARIETLVNERERLALAICGGEDALGYANAQSVGTLEKVARDNHNATMAQIDITLSLEAKLEKAVDVITCILATAYADDHTGWHNALDDARTLLKELEAKP